MWYRIEDGWYGCNYVREHHSSSSSSLDVIPKIRSSDLVQVQEILDKMTNNMDDNNWPSASHLIWAKRFAQSLDTTTVLTRGTWQLAPLGGRRNGHYDADAVQRIVDQPFGSGHFDFDTWAFPAWTLRPMSHPESGRVKWWRKQIASSSCLPPVLLWYFSGLDGYVVLDGHDRLLAASLEGRGVDVLCLKRVNFMKDNDPMAQLLRNASALHDGSYMMRFPDDTVEVSNRRLLEKHVPQLMEGRSRAIGTIPMSEWTRDVTAAVMSGSKDRQFLEEILDGLCNLQLKDSAINEVPAIDGR